MAACTINIAKGVPANPSVQQIQQPDGNTFQAVMRGDESQGWMETVDGYTVLKNEKTGFFEYAIKGPDGDLALSGIVVMPRADFESLEHDRRPIKGLRPLRKPEIKQ